MNENYYKLLGIDRETPISEIKRVYKQLAKKYHPDINNDPEAYNKFIEIKNAYEEILNPKIDNPLGNFASIFGILEIWHDIIEIEDYREKGEDRLEIILSKEYTWSKNKIKLLNKLYEKISNKYYRITIKELIGLEVIINHLNKVLNEEIGIKDKITKLDNMKLKPIPTILNRLYEIEMGVNGYSEQPKYIPKYYDFRIKEIKKFIFDVQNQFHPKFINKFPMKVQIFIHNKMREIITFLEKDISKNKQELKMKVDLLNKKIVGDVIKMSKEKIFIGNNVKALIDYIYNYENCTYNQIKKEFKGLKEKSIRYYLRGSYNETTGKYEPGYLIENGFVNSNGETIYAGKKYPDNYTINEEKVFVEYKEEFTDLVKIRKYKLDHSPKRDSITKEYLLSLLTEEHISYDIKQKIPNRPFKINEKKDLFEKTIKFLVYDLIINNPEIWFCINKKEDLDFSIEINCNLSEDQDSFKLFNILKKTALRDNRINDDTLNYLSLKLIPYEKRKLNNIDLEALYSKAYMNQDVSQQKQTSERIKRKEDIDLLKTSNHSYITESLEGSKKKDYHTKITKKN